jgi:hypothetical protein
LIFLACARSTFSFRLPPEPAVQLPEPFAITTFLCPRFSLIRSAFATFAAIVSVPLAAESTVHSNFTGAPLANAAFLMSAPRLMPIVPTSSTGSGGSGGLMMGMIPPGQPFRAPLPAVAGHLSAAP